MFFNSYEFLVFFSTFGFFFWVVPQKTKWLVFLAASWIFYASFAPQYLSILIFLIAVDFYAAKIIYKEAPGKKKKLFLAGALAANLALLFFFKYADFSIRILNGLFPGAKIGLLDLALPIGISFYTFQGISYIVDVYRQKIAPENNLGIFSLYKSAFPQLVAGPIERAGNLIPQLRTSLGVYRSNLKEGLFLVFAGLLKKIVIADNLGVVVDRIYNSYADYGGFALVAATFFFAFQIYCDFSGYVDIARGLGKLVGINFVFNFNKPYFSANITEFWHRWHISLSEWIRDYIYIPLGGNRKGKIRQYANLMLTMSVMGLWHGANLTFVFWGAYHGLLLVFDKIFGDLKIIAVFPKLVKTLATFLAVSFGWIFFRSNSMVQAAEIAKKIFSPSVFSPASLGDGALLAFWLVASLAVFEFLDSRFGLKQKILKLNLLYFSVFLTIFIYTLALFGVKESLSFIYFQF